MLLALNVQIAEGPKKQARNLANILHESLQKTIFSEHHSRIPDPQFATRETPTAATNYRPTVCGDGGLRTAWRIRILLERMDILFSGSLRECRSSTPVPRITMSCKSSLCFSGMETATEQPYSNSSLKSFRAPFRLWRWPLVRGADLCKAARPSVNLLKLNKLTVTTVLQKPTRDVANRVGPRVADHHNS